MRERQAMTNAHDTARLSAYLDGDLSPEAATKVEAHVAGCPRCAATLAELRAVVDAADRLPDLPPERDLWPAIEARLSPRRARDRRAGVIPIRRRRVVLTVPQLLAAAIALVLFSASGIWLALGGVGDPGTGSLAPALLGPAGTARTVAFTEYDRVIADLEAEYRSRRDQLDPATVQVVERNLAIIDRAITEARAALAADPSSGFLSAHLAGTMRQKAELLRTAAGIVQSET